MTGLPTQRALESRLWDAANALRGPVDPADFKAYIFPLLFLKRISDTWDAEHAHALADFAGDEDAALLADNYRFQVPTGCHWSNLRKASENVGVQLQTILDRIQEANPRTLAEIFGEVAWATRSGYRSTRWSTSSVSSTASRSAQRACRTTCGDAYAYARSAARRRRLRPVSGEPIWSGRQAPQKTQ